MKITVEYYDTILTIEESDDLDMARMTAIFRTIASGMTFGHSLIEEYIPEPNSPIYVIVKGGVATCEHPLVRIVDLDNH